MLAGYLAADLFLDGIGAALFVAGLGILEFLVLLALLRTALPSLLIEGAVLGGIGYAGELVGRPGAGFMLLELAAASAFLVSVAAGRPYLHRQLRTLTGKGMNPALAGRMTAVLGGVFLVHGLTLLVMMLTGGIDTFYAVLSFALLYLMALVLLRRKSRKESAGSVPVITAGDDGLSVLVLDGTVMGRVRLAGDRITDVGDVELPESGTPGEFLPLLETALASTGVRTVRFPGWTGDPSPLEMAGYRRIDGCWQRVLPAFR
jgi:hypothetical protein